MIKVKANIANYGVEGRILHLSRKIFSKQKRDSYKQIVGNALKNRGINNYGTTGTENGKP